MEAKTKTALKRIALHSGIVLAGAGIGAGLAYAFKTGRKSYPSLMLLGVGVVYSVVIAGDIITWNNALSKSVAKDTQDVKSDNIL